MSDDKDYSAQNNHIIEKFSRELERAQAKEAALKENMKITLASQLKDINIKKAIMREAKNAINSPNDRSLHNKAVEGVSGVDDGDVVTGFDRPWERD